MKNNAFFMVFCYFDFEEEKYGSYSIVLGKLMLEYKQAFTIRNANIR